MIRVEVRSLSLPDLVRIQTPCRVEIGDTIILDTVLYSVTKISPLTFMDSGAFQEVEVEGLF